MCIRNYYIFECVYIYIIYYYYYYFIIIITITIVIIIIILLYIYILCYILSSFKPTMKLCMPSQATFPVVGPCSLLWGWRMGRSGENWTLSPAAVDD